MYKNAQIATLSKKLSSLEVAINMCEQELRAGRGKKSQLKFSIPTSPAASWEIQSYIKPIEIIQSPV